MKTGGGTNNTTIKTNNKGARGSQGHRGWRRPPRSPGPAPGLAAALSGTVLRHGEALLECQSRTAPPAAEAGGSSHSPAAEHAAARLPSRAGNTRSRGARSGSPRGRPGAAPLGPNETAALPRSGPGAGGGTPGARSPSLAGPPPAAGSDWSSPPPRPAPRPGRRLSVPRARPRVPQEAPARRPGGAARRWAHGAPGDSALPTADLPARLPIESEGGALRRRADRGS